MFEDLHDPDDNSIREIINIHGDVYSCGPCGVKIKDEADFRTHLETHNFDCLYRCLYCSGLSPHTSDITEHIRDEHPGKEKYYGCLVFPNPDQIISVFRQRKAERPEEKTTVNASKTNDPARSLTDLQSGKTAAADSSASLAPCDTAVKVQQKEVSAATLERPANDKTAFESSQADEDVEWSDLEIPTDLEMSKLTASEDAHSASSDILDDDTPSRQDAKLACEQQDADDGESEADQEHDTKGGISGTIQPQVNERETTEKGETDQEEVIQEEANAQDGLHCKTPESSHSDEKEHASTADIAEVENTSDDQGQSSEKKVSVVRNASDEKKPDATKKGAAALADTDDDLDIEITGETSVPTQKRVPLMTPKPPGKEASFKTNLQCVYHRGMYTCKSCLESSKNYVEFARHLFTHLHEPNEEGGHDCTYCPYPIEEDCIVKPLACALVAQLMGMLQKQKKAHDWSRQLSGSLSPGTSTPSQPLRDNSPSRPSPKTEPSHLFSHGRHAPPRPFVLNRHSSDSQASANGQEENLNRKYRRINADLDSLPVKPIVIEPTSMEPDEHCSNNEGTGSDVSVTPSGDRDMRTTDATGREGSRRPSTSTNVSDDALQIDIPSMEPTVSGDHRSSFDEPPTSPIPPWTIEGNAAAIQIKPKGSKGPGYVLRCYHVNCSFRCARCEYSVHDSKPKVFRKHLWFEVHPYKTCDHCPDSVKYNRFMSCPVINELLTYLLEVKSKKDYDKAHNLRNNVEDVRDHVNSSKRKKHVNTTSDADSEGSALLDVVNEDNSSCGSNARRAMRNSSEFENGHGAKRRGSSAVASPTPTPTDVIAMIQCLNDPNVNESVTKPGVDVTEENLQGTDSNLNETESESMFIITSVVSQASEAGGGDEQTVGANAKSKTRDETQNNEEQEKDAESDDEAADYGAGTSPEGDTSSATESSNKNGQFLVGSNNVSRACAYAWDKSRKSAKSSSEPAGPEHQPTAASYTCGFYKCSFWAAADTEGFRIHNLINHKMTEKFCCAFCVEMFQSDEVLMQHQDNEHTDAQLFINFRPYHCGIKDCSWASNEQGEFVRHNEIFHPSTETYPCCFCRKVIGSLSKLLRHVNDSVRYSCSICSNIEPTYADIAKHVSSQHAPLDVDGYIQLRLTCVSSVGADGAVQYKTVNRCIDKHTAPTPKTATEEFQETFRCTNCGLLTCDEEYFESHIIECMKNPPLRTTKSPGSADLDPRSQRCTMPRDKKSEGKSMQTVDDDNDGENNFDEDESLPGLDPPKSTRYNKDPPPPTRKKGVLQSLGKGSPVICGKCSFKTQFRVVKAIHERVHLYSRDKVKTLWCPHCPYSTDSVLHLKIHVQGHSEKSRIRVYLCSHCSYSSNDVDRVEDHHEDVHGELELKSEVTRLVLEDLQCSDCPSISKCEDELLEHLEKQHGYDGVQKYLKGMYSIASLQIVDDENEEQEDDEVQFDGGAGSCSPRQESVAEEDAQLGSDRFQCTNCNYSCYKCGTWIRHMQRHNASENQEIVLYCCKTCKWKSTSKRKTIDHCKSRHNEIILEVQTMEFSTLKMGDDAMDDAPPEQAEETVGITKYHCDFCDFSTNEKAVLGKHWSTHEGQTTSGLDLKETEVEDDYLEDNTAELDQQMTVEGANEMSPNDYNEENLRLLDEAFVRLQYDEGKPCKVPIQCPICPYSSELRKCVRRHLVFHKTQAQIKNGFKCSYCPYMSEREGVVTRHMSVYHPDLPAKKVIIGRPKMKDEEQLARDRICTPSPVNTRSSQPQTAAAAADDKVFRMPRQCPKCDYTTKLQYNLLHHMRWHSKNTSEIGDEKASVFTIAAVTGRDGSNNMDVGEEKKPSVPRDPPSELTTDETLDSDDEYCRSLFCVAVPDKDLFKCKSCVFMAKDPAKIYLHYCTRHRNECPFQCGYCDFRSIAVIKIQQHCHVTHNNLPVRISPVVDEKAADNATTMDLGYRTVTADLIEDESTLDDEQREQAYDDWLSSFMIKCGNNVQMCNICGYEQKGQAALKRHVLAVHLRYYPYKCKHCAFSAVEANKILKHTDKNHPKLERRIIRRKIPDDLPSVIDCEKEALNAAAAAKESQEAVSVTPPPPPTKENIPVPMNVKIKEEPRSDPEMDDVYGGATDDNLSDDMPMQYGSELADTVRIKTEPRETEGELEEPAGNASSTKTPVKLSRRHRYPKQYTKTYRCTECNYMSKWNLADVKHHVLTVHLKIHPYSCRYCCFGSPRRGRLMEHYDAQHPGLPTSADEAREEIQAALSVVEDGDAVFIGLSEKSGDIESKYLPNVKPRTPKAPGANNNLGGRQRGSSSSRHSSPAPGPSSPSLANSPSPTKSPSRAGRLSLGGTPEHPLDLSLRLTPPPQPVRSGLIPGRNTQVLKVPTTLRVPTIPKPYPFDSANEQCPPSPPIPPIRIRKRSRKKEYTLYKCSSCGRGYVQKIKAQYHFTLKHLNLHPYICNYCSFGEDARKRVIDHIISAHPGQDLVVFPAFREHALVQEKVYPVQVDVSEYEGVMRAVKYINESGVLQHREKSEKCTVRCPQCSLMLPGMEDLDGHIASLHKDYTGFKCSYCGVYVKAKQKMRYHLTAKHPRLEALYQPIKEGVPYGNPLSTFDEIVRRKPPFLGQRKPPISNTNALTVAFPFYRPKQEKIGFANISKKRLSARCSRGYRENTGNLVEDLNLQMRVPTQPTPEETAVEGRPPPKMIKPRSDVVGGTVWLLCNHCTYTTLTSTLMRHHVMSHINYRPFRCSYCSFNGVRSHQVKKHMISMHHKLPPIVKYRTDALVERSLTDHFTMKVRRGNMEGSIKPFWNKNLPSHSSVKSNWNSRKSHEDGPIALKRLKIEQVMDRQEPEQKEEVAQAQNAGPVGEPEARRSEVYLCVLCGFRRPSRSSLLRHIMWELDYRPWSCPHCDYKDVTLVGVKKHCFQSHPKQPFKMVLKQDPERMSKIQAMVEQSKQPAVPRKSTPSASVGAIIKQEPVDPTEAANSLSSSFPGYTYNQPGQRESVYEAGMMIAVPSDNTVVTSAKQLEAQEEQQYSGDAHIYRCKHCTFQSPDKTCFKKHILRHGPKRFQCGYCSYCAVFKAELHKHMSRLHKRKPYKIITLADNQVVTSKVKTLTNRLKPIPMFPRAELAPVAGPTDETAVPQVSARLSIDPAAEGGMLAQLEAELKGMDSDGGPDRPAAESKRSTPTKRKISDEGGEPQESLAFAVLDGVVLTEDHLTMNAAGEYRCGFCDLTSTNREKSRTHLAKHFQLRWKCSHCDLKHQLSYEMRRHIRSKHPGYPIKMARLETNGDFVSSIPKARLPPKESHVKSPTNATVSSLQATPYSRPGPACSKKHRPAPEPSAFSIPSVFCCFLCSFKTNSTLELIDHQKTHAGAAQEDRMPTLSPVSEPPKEPTVSAPAKENGAVLRGDGCSEATKTMPEKRAPPVYYASDASEEFESPSRQNFVRPFKCGYCDFSGFARGKVKNHCTRIHKDKPALVVDQQRKEVSSKKGSPEHMQMPQLTSAAPSDEAEGCSADKSADAPQLGGTALSVMADDVLSIPQLELEGLLKQHNLKGIRW